MSEYWKSTPKYWCKHCTTYVKDTPFERRNHEATGKHQGNLKRFLRDIQNNHERDEREKQKAKAEIDRLNKVVGGASAGVAPTATASAKPTGPANTASGRKSAAATLTAADQKRQWDQLAAMGVQVPDNYRAEMATASDWKSVSEPSQSRIGDAPPDALSVGVRKRKLDPDEQAQAEVEADEPPAAKRVWGKSVRHFPGQTVDDGLDDLLASKTLLKKEKSEVDVKQEPAEAVVASLTSPDTGVKSQALEATANPVEANDESIPLVKSEAATTGDEQPVHAPIFKKRKGKQALK